MRVSSRRASEIDVCREHSRGEIANDLRDDHVWNRHAGHPHASTRIEHVYRPICDTTTDGEHVLSGTRASSAKWWKTRGRVGQERSSRGPVHSGRVGVGQPHNDNPLGPVREETGDALDAAPRERLRVAALNRATREASEDHERATDTAASDG